MVGRPLNEKFREIIHPRFVNSRHYSLCISLEHAPPVRILVLQFYASVSTFITKRHVQIYLSISLLPVTRRVYPSLSLVGRIYRQTRVILYVVYIFSFI